MIDPLKLSKDYIFKDHYDGDLGPLYRRAHRLLNQSQYLSDKLERNGGLSSATDRDAPHFWPEALPVLNWAKDRIDWIWDYWEYSGSKKSIGASWVNIHPNGGWTDEHHHGMVPMVAVIYLKQPENGGNLLVFDPMFHHWSGGPLTELPYKEIKVQTGDIVIFPGWLLHKTQSNQSQEDRIVMSVNITALDMT